MDGWELSSHALDTCIPYYSLLFLIIPYHSLSFLISYSLSFLIIPALADESPKEAMGLFFLTTNV